MVLNFLKEKYLFCVWGIGGYRCVYVCVCEPYAHMHVCTHVYMHGHMTVTGQLA